MLADIVLRSAPNKARNDCRGYGLNPQFTDLIPLYEDSDWYEKVKKTFLSDMSVKEKLERHRTIELIPVTLADGEVLEFSKGEHNDLQKAIIEEFLPRYGFQAELFR